MRSRSRWIIGLPVRGGPERLPSAHRKLRIPRELERFSSPSSLIMIAGHTAPPLELVDAPTRTLNQENIFCHGQNLKIEKIEIAIE